MEYINKNLGTYNLHLIRNTNFKQIMVTIYFREPIKKENITKRNFLTTMLTTSTKKYNTKRKMVLKTEDLYSTIISGTDSRLGNYLNTKFTLTVLKDKYTESGNFESALEFLSEIIYKPNVTKNKFDAKSFDIVMNSACLALSSVKEDSASYSVMRMLENMDEESPISYRSFGYLEDLKDINESNLYEYYENMLKNDNMDIFVIGDIDMEETDNLVRKYFTPKKFKKTKGDFLVESKKAPFRKRIVTEENNSNQSQVVLGYRINNIEEYERNYPLTLYNIILGGSGDSKLFTNIREKKSLCYSIYSTVNKLDNILLIRAGINREDFKETVKLIEKEVAKIAKGKITEEEINNAKEMYKVAVEEIMESESAITSSYYMMDLLGTDDIETRVKKMNEVTKEEIVKVAKKIKIDTAYMLEGVAE